VITWISFCVFRRWDRDLELYKDTGMLMWPYFKLVGYKIFGLAVF